MKRNIITVLIGVMLIIVFGLWLFVFQVRQSEVAVVTTFSKPTRPITAPGAHLRLPWPIQMVHKFEQRVQNFEDKLTQGLTRDSFSLLTSVYVGWKITEPATFFTRFGASAAPITEAEKLLEQRLDSAKIAAGKYRGPLHGIPWGAKDLVDTAGIATTYGAEPFRNRVPKADAVTVARLHQEIGRASCRER